MKIIKCMSLALLVATSGCANRAVLPSLFHEENDPFGLVFPLLYNKDSDSLRQYVPSSMSTDEISCRYKKSLTAITKPVDCNADELVGSSANGTLTKKDQAEQARYARNDLQALLMLRSEEICSFYISTIQDGYKKDDEKINNGLSLGLLDNAIQAVIGYLSPKRLSVETAQFASKIFEGSFDLIGTRYSDLVATISGLSNIKILRARHRSILFSVQHATIQEYPLQSMLYDVAAYHRSCNLPDVKTFIIGDENLTVLYASAVPKNSAESLLAHAKSNVKKIEEQLKIAKQKETAIEKSTAPIVE